MEEAADSQLRSVCGTGSRNTQSGSHGWRRDSNLTVAARRWSLFGSAAAQYCSRDCCLHLYGTTDRCVVARGWLHRAVRASTVTIQSVAVLPLDNLSGDQEQDFFADGMTDELITMLAKISSLRVCERENIKAALNGTIAALGSQYVMSLEAVNCRSGDTLAREQVTADAKEKVLPALAPPLLGFAKS